jgi:hypothetical protein
LKEGGERKSKFGLKVEDATRDQHVTKHAILAFLISQFGTVTLGGRQQAGFESWSGGLKHAPGFLYTMYVFKIKLMVIPSLGGLVRVLIAYIIRSQTCHHQHS